jgi:carbon storage regulator
MLVLGRKQSEKVLINGNITLTVVEIQGNRVRLAIDAPVDVRILRGELLHDASDADLAQKPAEWLEADRVVSGSTPFVSRLK